MNTNELNENHEQQLFAAIENEKKNNPAAKVIDTIKEFETMGGTLEDPAATFIKLAKKYPQEKEDLKKWAITKNKAIIKNTTHYLERKKINDPNKYYTCKVFQQNNNEQKTPQPLKFPRGTLSYIGAMTHRGKTTALISICLDALLNKQKVYFITTEETPDQILDRMLKAILYTYCKDIKEVFSFNTVKNKYELKGIDGDKLGDRIDDYLYNYQGKGLEDTEPKNLQECIYKSFELLNEMLSNNQFTILDHTQQKSFDELYNTIDLLEDKSVIILDYIQHVKKPVNAGSDNRQVIIQNESQQLSDIAGHKDLIIIAGGQFNRKGNNKDTEKDKYNADFLDPTLFRESGDIEQDAHLVIGIGQQLHKEENAIGENVTRFYEILKQRGVKADTNQYLIIDNATFSLYSCNLQKTKNGNTTLIYYQTNTYNNTNNDNQSVIKATSKKEYDK